MRSPVSYAKDKMRKRRVERYERRAHLDRPAPRKTTPLVTRQREIPSLDRGGYRMVVAKGRKQRRKERQHIKAKRKSARASRKRNRNVR